MPFQQTKRKAVTVKKLNAKSDIVNVILREQAVHLNAIALVV